MEKAISQQYIPEDMMAYRLENGRLFHLWVIRITPLNSRKLNAGVKSEN